MTRVWGTRVVWAALLPALAFGQVDARAKRIVDDAVDALGGEKFLTMTDRVESGRAYSFYREKISGLDIATIYTRYLTIAVGKSGQELGVREKQAFGKNGDTGVVFREEGGFDVGFRGVKPLDPEVVTRYKNTTMHNILYILRQRLHEPGMIIEARGVDVIDNLPVEKVEFIDSENRSVTVAFHRSTKVPVWQEWILRDPKTKDRSVEVTKFGRWASVNGVQWPHQITRERDGDRIFQMFSDTVTIGKDIPESVFSVDESKYPAAPTPTSKKKK